MRTSDWRRFLIVGLAAAVGCLMAAGCEDDDGDDADEAAATTAVVNTNAVDLVEGADDDATTVPPSATTQVLLDRTSRVLGESSWTVQTAATPAAGTVRIEATWTTIDLIAGGAPIDIPLEFTVNEGVAGAGGFHNAGHASPFSGAVSMPANTACKIEVGNNVNDCIAEVHLRAVFTSN